MSRLERYQVKFVTNGDVLVCQEFCLASEVEKLDAELTQLRERAIPESWTNVDKIVADCQRQVATVGNTYRPSFDVVQAILNLHADAFECRAEVERLTKEQVLQLELNGTVNDQYIQLAEQHEAERKRIAEEVASFADDCLMGAALKELHRLASRIERGEFVTKGEKI